MKRAGEALIHCVPHIFPCLPGLNEGWRLNHRADLLQPDPDTLYAGPAVALAPNEAAGHRDQAQDLIDLGSGLRAFAVQRVSHADFVGLCACSATRA